MYQLPIFNAIKMVQFTGIPSSNCRKYLNILEKAGVIYSDGKARNRTYYNYNLIDVLNNSFFLNSFQYIADGLAFIYGNPGAFCAIIHLISFS